MVGGDWGPWFPGLVVSVELGSIPSQGAGLGVAFGRGVIVRPGRVWP